jgi:hypothetical protein
MTDVFINFTRTDHELAQKLVRALASPCMASCTPSLCFVLNEVRFHEVRRRYDQDSFWFIHRTGYLLSESETRSKGRITPNCKTDFFMHGLT